MIKRATSSAAANLPETKDTILMSLLAQSFISSPPQVDSGLSAARCTQEDT